MARAQGARAQMALAFETTYGTPPVGGFTKMPFASTSLGAEQPLLNAELLGYGRDPLAPIKDAVTADGDVVVPLDAEAFGFWLKAAFGDPTTTGTGPWTHEFQSGAWALPSISIETGMPELPRFAMYSGCVLDQINWQMQRSGLLTATARLVAQAINGDPCEMEFAYVLPSGESFTFTVHAVYLPRPRIEISGPQGVQATFDWQAARDSVVGRMCTATLVNDVEIY